MDSIFPFKERAYRKCKWFLLDIITGKDWHKLEPNIISSLVLKKVTLLPKKLLLIIGGLKDQLKNVSWFFKMCIGDLWILWTTIGIWRVIRWIPLIRLWQIHLVKSFIKLRKNRSMPKKFQLKDSNFTKTQNRII